MAPRWKPKQRINPETILRGWKQAEYDLEYDPGYIEQVRFVQAKRMHRSRNMVRREIESWRIRTGFTWLWTLGTLLVIIILAGNYKNGNWSTINDIYQLSDMAHFGLMWLTWSTLTVIMLVTRIIPNE